MELLVLPWMMQASMKPPLGDFSSMNGRSCCMKAGPHAVMASSSFCLHVLGLYLHVFVTKFLCGIGNSTRTAASTAGHSCT